MNVDRYNAERYRYSDLLNRELDDLKRKRYIIEQPYDMSFSVIEVESNTNLRLPGRYNREQNDIEFVIQAPIEYVEFIDSMTNKGCNLNRRGFRTDFINEPVIVWSLNLYDLKKIPVFNASDRNRRMIFNSIEHVINTMKIYRMRRSSVIMNIIYSINPLTDEINRYVAFRPHCIQLEISPCSDSSSNDSCFSIS